LSSRRWPVRHCLWPPVSTRTRLSRLPSSVASSTPQFKVGHLGCVLASLAVLVVRRWPLSASYAYSGLCSLRTRLRNRALAKRQRLHLP
jgi:hypothetical protein